MDRRLASIVLIFAAITAQAFGQATQPADALARLPVKEITAFKDGHALVLHEGRLPTQPDGTVVMDYLPNPIIGTFWPYATGEGAKLTSVTAGQRKVAIDQTALTLRELVEANIGAEVIVTESSAGTYHAKLAGWPTRSGEELEASSPPNGGPKLEQKGEVILVTTEQGTKVVNVAQITQLTFKGPYNKNVRHEEFRNTLTLKLDWKGGQTQPEAGVGMLYVQKGVRWIPSYKVTIDGKGKARLQLEATILNELADLEDVTIHLVVGVPTFAFKDTIDPMALQQAVAQLSPYFQSNAQTSYALSNAIMTQTARMGEHRGQMEAPSGAGAGALPGELPGAEGTQREDLFIFTVEGVTLRKGERMVVPVSESEMPYRDAYTLDLPFGPPPELRQQIDDRQQAEIARLLASPKAMHKLRLTNDTKTPLTTAPALILSGDRVVGQAMMTYTSPGGECDIEMATAVNVRVSRSEEVTERTPNAVQWDNKGFARLDLRGTVTLRNFTGKAVAVEVNRYVLGRMDEAAPDGRVTQLNWWEELESGAYTPNWRHWYGWPSWWSHLNGMGRARWTVKLEPGATEEVTYAWHYFWP